MIIKAIFVSQQGLGHQIIAETVEFFSHSEENFLGHAAIYFQEVVDINNGVKYNEVIFEALREGLDFYEGHKYDNEPERKIITMEIPQYRYDMGVSKALILQGTPYGLWTDCIATGIRENFSAEDVARYEEFVNCKETMHCSETFSVIWNAMFEDFMANEDYNSISPRAAYKYLLEFIQTHQDEIKIISIDPA